MNSIVSPSFVLRGLRNGNRLLQLYYGLPIGGRVSSPASVPEVRCLVRHFAKLVSFPLAQTGEGISECELVAWAVKPGDIINPFDKLCDVQSDKAAIEITSRYGGRVLALHHSVGKMVKVGAPLVDIEVPDDVPVPPEHLATAQQTSTAVDNRSRSNGGVGKDSNAQLAADVASTASKAVLQGADLAAAPTPPASSVGPVVQSASVPSPRPEPSPAPLSTGGSGFSSAIGTGTGRARVQASPAVRAFARENGVDLRMVTGTGPGGRVTRADVLQYIDSQPQTGRHVRWSGASAEEEGEEGDDREVTLQASDFLDVPGPAVQAVAAPAGGGGGGAAAGGPGTTGSRFIEELLAQYKRLAPSPPSARIGGGGGGLESGSKVVPLRGYRRAMVASMTAAASVPVFHFHDEVAVDRLLAAREVLRGDAALRRAGVKLTVLPLMLKALSAALSQHPYLNASLAPGGSELVVHPSHNIGVAMATPAGLVVPNIKQVERKSVIQVASELHLLQQLAIAGRLPQDALSGGTITLSNIGTIGGTYATPLVTPPEVAIVALGRLQVVPRYPPGDPGAGRAGTGTGTGTGMSPAAAAAAADMGPPGLSGSGAAGMGRWGTGSTPVQMPVPVSIMPISWGADHRVVDGASLAAFSNTWKGLVEQPDKLLLHLT